VTVVAHQEVALDKVVDIKVKHAFFTIVDELELDCAVDLVCGDAVLLGDVLKLTDDHAEDLGEGDGLHAIPADVACRRRIQNSRDKRTYVLYPAGLRMEHGNDNGVTPRRDGVAAWQRRRWWSALAAGQPLRPRPLG
jgi:hypothetical protein